MSSHNFYWERVARYLGGGVGGAVAGSLCGSSSCPTCIGDTQCTVLYLALLPILDGNRVARWLGGRRRLFCFHERIHVCRLQQKRKGGRKEDCVCGGGARGLARAGRTSTNLQLDTLVL